MRRDSPDEGHDGDCIGGALYRAEIFYIMRHHPRRRHTIARARLMAGASDRSKN
jgi:hypothetical protein